MPFLPADIARCVVSYDMPDNVVAQNRFTAAWNGTTSLDDNVALNNWEAYLDDIYSVVSGEISDQLTITGFELYRVVVIGGEETLEFIGVGSISNQPSNANDMIPHGAAMQFNARLNGPGRGSAKKFFPGFVDVGVVNGIFIPMVITTLQPALTDWVSNFGSGNDWIPGAYSVSKGFRSMLMPVARNVVSYQRRRKPGVGI